MSEQIKLKWLENRAEPKIVTWGVPWEKGRVFDADQFTLMNSEGTPYPMESRTNAYWPDQSLKWTVHTADLRSEQYNTDEVYRLSSQKLQVSQKLRGISIVQTEHRIFVDTGRVQAEFCMGGPCVIENMVTDGRLAAKMGESVFVLEEIIEKDAQTQRIETTYISHVQKVSVELDQALECVIKVEGVHKQNTTGETMIPFVFRFIFTHQEASIKLTHTFLLDWENKDWFMKGLGLRFYCPIEGETYNRHIKISSEEGVFHEAAQLLLSWRPKIDPQIYKNQCDGALLYFDEEKEIDQTVLQAISDMTIWDSYRLSQDSNQHFSIKKSTGKKVCSYIEAVHGNRSPGFTCIAGEKGGFAIGMKDYWQKYPSSTWVDGLSKDEAMVTLWIWSYESEGMDFRHYDTKAHASAYYEGFDEVGSSPYGIANTNQITLFGYTGPILSDELIHKSALQIQKPALLIATPEYYKHVKALGEWGLSDRSTPMKLWLEDQLDKAFAFYKAEIEQRKWYGLFHYGDVMHTYDANRHTWRYDMGGYAWQNTELVPTLWLATAFLRSGREDIFTVMEAMNRHCSEVDTYHLGDFKGIGSRHNVIHWGCACKEPRIAMAGHHRLYYYMTGDYRMRDIFDEVKDGDFATLKIDPLRYFYDKEKMIYPTHARTGPDWSTYCSNWMTAWEQGELQYKKKIEIGIEDISKAPLKLISGSDFEYDPKSSHLRYIGESAAGGSHLTICMGGAQVWIELALVLDDPKWNKMLADYGVFYFATPAEKMKWSDGLIEERDWPLPYMASTMGMYGARYYEDAKLGQKVWKILMDVIMTESDGAGFQVSYVNNHILSEKLAEIPWISTNFTAQWCLNVISCLALGEVYLPKYM